MMMRAIQKSPSVTKRLLFWRNKYSIGDEEAEQDDKDAQGPEAGEDEADAGYGGDENYGNEEVEENRDEIGDQDAEPEEETMEIQYDKDSEGEGIDLYRDDNEEEFEDRREAKKKRREKDRGERGEKTKKKKHREKYEEAEEDEYAEGNEGKKKKRKKKEDEADTVTFIFQKTIFPNY